MPLKTYRISRWCPWPSGSLLWLPWGWVFPRSGGSTNSAWAHRSAVSPDGKHFCKIASAMHKLSRTESASFSTDCLESRPLPGAERGCSSCTEPPCEGLWCPGDLWARPGRWDRACWSDRNRTRRTAGTDSGDLRNWRWNTKWPLIPNGRWKFSGFYFKSTNVSKWYCDFICNILRLTKYEF